MSNTTEVATPTITAADVRDPNVLIGFNGALTTAALRQSIANALHGADAVATEAVRKAFVLGWAAAALAKRADASKAPKATIATVTAAAVAIATSKSARTPDQFAAVNAATVAWHRYAAPEKTPAEREAAKVAKAAKASTPAQSETTQQTPAAPAAPAAPKYATLAEGHAFGLQALNNLRAAMDKYPTAFDANMIKVADQALRNWSNLKVADVNA